MIKIGFNNKPSIAVKLSARQGYSTLTTQLMMYYTR